MSSTILIVFIVKQTADRQRELNFRVLKPSAYCTGLEPLHEPPQSKICHRLHRRYTSFSVFSLIWSFTIWKSIFLWIKSYLDRFDNLKKADQMFFKDSSDKICCVTTILCTYYESISINVSKKLDLMLNYLWMRKNIAS